MKSKSVSQTMLVLLIAAIMIPLTAGAAEKEEAKKKVEKPKDRVVLMYFHRTERCPTCKKIGSYCEEAVASEFEKQVETGLVSLYFIDFQDKKNAALTKAYKISGPTLVMAQVKDGKVATWKQMTKVWTLVGDKPEMMKYIQQAIVGYLPG